MNGKYDIHPRVIQWKYPAIAAVLLLVICACAVSPTAYPASSTPPSSTAMIFPTSTPKKIPLTVIAPRSFSARVDGVHLGDPNAPVKIDVWEDFQCPACKTYSERVETEVIANLVETGKAYYTFHFFPFLEVYANPPTQESHQAANAAMCASAQGRFWDFHDMLFANWAGENEGGFSTARLAAMAEALELDMDAFTACYQSDQYRSQIDQDMAAGELIGVQGTPSVFVNGTLLTPGYVPSYDDVLKAVEAALSGQ